MRVYFLKKYSVCVLEGVPGVPVFPLVILKLNQSVAWNTTPQNPEHLRFQVFRLTMYFQQVKRELALDCYQKT